MTIKEIVDEAMDDAGLTEATARVSLAQLLAWYSDYRKLLIEETNILKLSYDITLDGNSLDGGYTLPPDIKHMDKISWAPSSAWAAETPVGLTTWGAFQDSIYAEQNGAVPPPYQTPQSGQILRAAVSLGKLWIYPFVGATGIVTLHYTPAGLRYSPSNTVEWAAFNPTPGTAMATTKPERELRRAELGMKEYVVARIIEKMGWMGTKADRYQVAVMQYQKVLEQIRRTAVEPAQARGPFYDTAGGIL